MMAWLNAAVVVGALVHIINDEGPTRWLSVLVVLLALASFIVRQRELEREVERADGVTVNEVMSRLRQSGVIRQG